MADAGFILLLPGDAGSAESQFCARDWPRWDGLREPQVWWRFGPSSFLFAIEGDSPIAKGGWPTYRGNQQRTGQWVAGAAEPFSLEASVSAESMTLPEQRISPRGIHIAVVCKPGGLGNDPHG